MDTPQPKTVALDRARFHLAEHYQQHYVAVVPQGTDPRSLEDPAFFSNVAFMCRAAGRIFVECEDGTWLADLYIRSVGPQFVMAKLLQVWDMSDFAPPEAAAAPTAVFAGYKVGWSGRHTKWRVVRESDNAIIHSGEDSREAAEGWLREHMKAAVR